MLPATANYSVANTEQPATEQQSTEQQATPTAEQESDERRQFHRVPFVTIASVHNSELNAPVELLDLSLKGALFRVLGSSELAAGTELKLHIILSNDIYIEMLGCIVRQDSDFDGFECTSIDLDSARHLIRLVELNLGDPDLMERDLSALNASHHWA